MLRPFLRLLPAVICVAIAPADAAAQVRADSAAIREVHETIRRYDEALRRADVEAAGRFWAPELVFVNPRGERLTRAQRLANLRERRTTFDSLAPVPQQEHITVYGNVAVHTTLLAIGGRYSGRPEHGQLRALVVWVRRNGRWQQVANQLTPVMAPSTR